MMQRIRFWLTPRYAYPNTLDMQRARSMFVVLGISTLGMIVYSLILLIQIANGTAELNATQLSVFATPFVTIFLLWMINRGWLQIPIIGLIAFSLLTSVPGLSQDVGAIDSIVVVLPVVVAGVLLGWRGTMVTLVITLLVVANAAFIAPETVSETATADFTSITLVLIVITDWLIFFGTNIQESARRTLANFERMRFITQLEETASDESDQQQLGNQITHLLREEFGYDFAQIFLLDTDGTIQQRLASGIATTQSQIDIMPGSAIREVIRTGQLVQVNNESDWRLRSHFLPGTGSAVSLPIRAGSVLIAVLDIQLEENRRFDESELTVLSLLSGYLGNSLGRLLTVNSLRADLNDQETIIANLRERLRELEQTAERETTVGWSAYLGQRNLDYLGFDIVPDDSQPILATTLSDDLRAALTTDDIVVEARDDHQVMQVPIMLRGQKLGVMTFKIPAGEQALGGRQRELIRSVVQRLGLALENKRLFERSQAQAQRESTANEIGNLLLTTTDVESVLRLAATSFNDALGAIQTNIHLQPDAQEALEENA